MREGAKAPPHPNVATYQGILYSVVKLADGPRAAARGLEVTHCQFALAISYPPPASSAC